MSQIIIPSTNTLFRETFHSLGSVLSNGAYIGGSISVDKSCDFSGGGYLVYPISRLASTNYWSVYVKCSFASAASDRVILAVGKSGIGDRFEIGIDSSDELYMTGSSGTVTSSDSVSSGSRKLLFVYDGSNITFYVDGVRIGTSSVSLGAYLLPIMHVGAATDGSSRKIGSTTIDEIKIYNYPLSESEAFDASDVDGWTPKNLLSAYGGSYDDGMYWDGDEDGAYGLNDQAIFSNWDFNPTPA